MSVSVALQKLIFDALRATPGLNSMIGGRVYDQVPETPKFPYLSFGPYDFVSDDADCIVSGDHTLQIDIWSRGVGRVEAKQITDATRRILHGYDGDMGEYGLVEMRVDLARVIGDPDVLTSHGIIQITANIEEPE